MTLKDIDLKYSYDSDSDDILHDFYIPIISEGLTYKRLAGFFSSSVLAIVASGMSQFILNGGSMQLVCSANFSKSDLEAIKQAQKTPQELIKDSFINDLDNLEEGFEKDHVRALGWMIANDKLDIKIAIVQDNNGNVLDSESIEKY